MALEYGLKDLPCSIEWIDVCYKCIRFSIDEYGAITLLCMTL